MLRFELAPSQTKAVLLSVWISSAVDRAFEGPSMFAWPSASPYSHHTGHLYAHPYLCAPYPQAYTAFASKARSLG